jgi:hypothetical protein
LRTSDGVYFTPAGARKLAHYVEREVQRWLTVRPTSVAVATPEEPKAEAVADAAGRSGPHARPLAGPAIPLTAERGRETDDLLGSDRQLAADTMVTKVLVRGEAVTAPAGRADDFVWPRRDVAPVGSDPVVATTDLPMTPMVAERDEARPATGAVTRSREVATADAVPAKRAAHRRVTPQAPVYAYAQSMYRPDTDGHLSRRNSAFNPCLAVNRCLVVDGERRVNGRVVSGIPRDVLSTVSSRPPRDFTISQPATYQRSHSQGPRRSPIAPAGPLRPTFRGSLEAFGRRLHPETA